MSQKRKLEEYHDPDYPQNSDDKRQRTSSGLPSEERSARIRQIINREFNREVQFREAQLEEIDSKLAKAKELLHQIRYNVVADYYSKQHLQYSEAEAVAAQGRSLFDNEPDGPQMPLHPAIKKIIGKKPKTYDELLRVRPTVREAAKTAKTSIKEKSRTKKEEKRIQRMIKQRGIVIDHSLPENSPSSSTVTSSMIEVRNPSGPIKIPRHISPIKVEKPVPKLNTARLNNQTKHLIVVGNTSKYIGDEKPSDNSSHKWMIYVQAKSAIPIEKFVTKVRFFLHSSYRPNDVVDVESSPFQLARRGWGEFPVRLQLFFDPRIDQKPVQLVHNLVLDKTLSGLQTMGAETLVEIWLRTDNIIPPLSPPQASPKPSRLTETITKSKHLLSPTKTAEIINPKAEIDDNLFDFLDKIESPAICADIEKIQPTFMDSPLVDTPIARKPLGLPPARNITESIMRLSEEPSTSVPSSSNNKITSKSNLMVDQENGHIHQPIKAPQPRVQTPPNATKTSQTATGPNPLLTNPKLLQKQLVQFIDKQGNVKFLQMLIAPKSLAQPQRPLNGVAKGVAAPLANGDQIKIVAKPPVTDTNGNTRLEKDIKTETMSPPPTPLPRIGGAAPKNQVIHKEGKLYIIDPLQTKLKQEQKKQVSLLKPQVSLLKPIVQNDNLNNCIRNNASNVFNHTSIATDHDYTTRLNPNRLPANTVTISKSPGQVRPAVFRHPNTITVRNLPNPANFIPSRVPELKKGNFIPVKVNHKPVIALMKKHRREYRRELEQQFKASTFASVRSAVEFLLRRLPMVNSLALESDYRMSFPFVVGSWTDFRRTIPVKLKALEWLRAKYIASSVAQHPSLKTANFWTTKELIVFARHHAYTPVIHSMEKHQQMKGSAAVKDEADASLTELVKSEIEKEQLRYQTVTPNHVICDWTEAAWKRVSTHHSASDAVIDVDSLEDDQDSALQRRCPKESPLKDYQGKVWLSIDEKLDKEAYLVNGMCQEIGIRLQPEEIHRDVIHPTAQTLMAQTLRLFVQDLVRRSVAFKSENTNDRSPLNQELEPNDIRSAINSRAEFDFLTNKYFGTIKSKDLLELG